VLLGHRRATRPLCRRSRCRPLSAGEFNAIAGVTDERHRVKELFRHPQTIPRAVVLDPTVTVHTPEWLWLSPTPPAFTDVPACGWTSVVSHDRSTR
jgi:hypothetical protein